MTSRGLDLDFIRPISEMHSVPYNAVKTRSLQKSLAGHFLRQITKEKHTAGDNRMLMKFADKNRVLCIISVRGWHNMAG